MARYLLGDLAEEERRRLEDAYFADDQLFEELEATETDLIDAYLRDELPADDHARFEAHFLSSPRRRARVDLARRLLKVGRAPVPSPGSGWRAAIARWRRRPVLVPALAAAALLLVVAGTWWTWRSAPGQAPSLPVQQEAQNVAPAPPTEASGGRAPSRPTRSDRPTPAAPSMGPIALVLVPGLTRAPGGGSTLVLPASESTVRIRIEYEGDAHAAYSAAIRTPGGALVWSQSGLKPTGPGEKSAIIAIPVASLSPGDYALTLTAIEPGRAPEDVADYAFRVVRR